MKKTASIARFLCEHCGSSVRFDSTICENCKRIFRGVRCPECNHLGTGRLFLHGCPSCGYGNTSTSQKEVQVLSMTDVDPPHYKRKTMRIQQPQWVYLLFGAPLIAVMIIALLTLN